MRDIKRGEGIVRIRLSMGVWSGIRRFRGDDDDADDDDADDADAERTLGVHLMSKRLKEDARSLVFVQTRHLRRIWVD